MTEDYTEYDFLNILYQNPELIDAVQVIWNFEKPFAYDPLNWVWASMKDLYLSTGTISRIKLRREFNSKYPNFEGDVISTISQRGCFPEQLQGYLNEIRSRMITRELQSMSHQIIHQDLSVDGMKVLEMATQKIRSIEQGMTFEADIDLPEAIKRVKEKAERITDPKNVTDYIKTGFRGLDSKITGLELGRMTVVAARPSVGKTAYALSMLGNIELHNIQCAFLSCEMDVESLVKRRIQQISGISMREIANASEKQSKLLSDFQHYCNEYQRVSKSIFRCLSHDRRVSNVKLQMRKIKNQNPNVKVIFIDYLQKIKADKKGHDKASEIGEISGDLTDMAKELNVSVVLLAQLNRGAESQDASKNRPKMSQLKGSGDIEQDADNILLVHRARLAYKHHDPNPVQDCELIIAKARDAAVGTTTMKFVKNTTLFRDKVDDDHTGGNL
ncbi:MAG: DnaB-like helicase C-terminal domain-containing protein [Lentisphaeraceae bacterium]|nr:DnaB-like helicase C-terminal domain-containing protein [Lentisphaeraceae bacterium]